MSDPLTTFFIGLLAGPLVVVLAMMAIDKAIDCIAVCEHGVSVDDHCCECDAESG
jgi:hypothetical protein